MLGSLANWVQADRAMAIHPYLNFGKGKGVWVCTNW
jgi:hypothetical protein